MFLIYIEPVALRYFSDPAFFLLQRISLTVVHPWALPAFHLDPQCFPFFPHPRHAIFIPSSSSSKLLEKHSGLPEVGLFRDCLLQPETHSLFHIVWTYGRGHIEMEAEWKEAVGLDKPDKSSPFGSRENPDLRRHAVKADEWVRCFCVYLQEQEKIGRHSCKRATFRRTALRYRVQSRVSIMWP